MPPQSLNQLFQSALQAHQSNQINTAIELYHQVLEIFPNHINASINLGIALCHQQKTDDAIKLLEQTVSISKENYHLALYNYGTALLLNHQDQAKTVNIFLQLYSQEPDNNDIHYKLAVALLQNSEFRDALNHLKILTAKEPKNSLFLKEMAFIYEQLGEFKTGLETIKQAHQLSPDNINIQLNYSIALLRLGFFELAWPLYESRLIIEQKKYGDKTRLFSTPSWKGESLQQKTLLIHGEQGLGDNIQYLRFFPLIKSLGANIIFICPYEIALLIKNNPLIDQLISPKKPTIKFEIQPSQIPHDYQTPLMSIPFALSLKQQKTPPPCKNIQTLKNFKTRISIPTTPLLKVGLCWRGNPKHSNDRNRSIHISKLQTLSTLANIRFYSLQFQPQNNELAQFSDNIVDLGSTVNNMAETAHYINSLDLIISVDTSICHLAGTLGKAVWILLPFCSDWRWLTKTSETFWYPTAKLFRQRTYNCWDTAIEDIKQHLEIENEKVSL